jgi:hypothetical protein
MRGSVRIRRVPAPSPSSRREQESEEREEKGEPNSSSSSLDSVLFSFSAEGVAEGVPRGTARELWRAGRLAALFNLPFDPVGEELFDSCVDFCVESTAAAAAPPALSESSRFSNEPESGRKKDKGRRRNSRSRERPAAQQQQQEHHTELSEGAATLLKSLMTPPAGEECASCGALRKLNESLVARVTALRSELADANAANVVLRDELSSAKRRAEDLDRIKAQAQTRLKVADGERERAQSAKRQSQISTVELADELIRLRELNSDLSADAHFLREENRRLRAEFRTRGDISGPGDGGVFGATSDLFPSSSRDNEGSAWDDLTLAHARGQAGHEDAFTPRAEQDAREGSVSSGSRGPDQTDLLNQHLLAVALSDMDIPAAVERGTGAHTHGDEWE